MQDLHCEFHGLIGCGCIVEDDETRQNCYVCGSKAHRLSLCYKKYEFVAVDLPIVGRSLDFKHDNTLIWTRSHSLYTITFHI